MDWQRELADPKKAEAGLLHPERFWIVAPSGVVRAVEAGHRDRERTKLADLEYKADELIRNGKIAPQTVRVQSTRRSPSSTARSSQRTG